MTRVAALDLGTNTTRLLVADVEDGRVDEIARLVRITRLGEGVDSRRRLLPLPVARVRNCLTDYRRVLEAHAAERTLAVATSAVRDADNGEAFLGEVEWSYGFSTRLASGAEEARLTFRGATLGRDLDEATLVVDIGGGSTELVVGDAGGVQFDTSLDIGSVRMTERFVRSDPPAPEELADCVGAVRSLLAERIADEVRALPRQAIGVAATITTFAALDLALPAYDREQVQGHVLSREGVDRQLERLAALPLAERRAVPALEPERAPVIVAGGIILREVLDHFRLPALEASERDILDGIALEAAALPEPVEGNAPPGAYTCC
ncbi:MAG: Ppx/GppA family phosphatase [Thermoleophilia bacterium]|nr:Ppx/GppA family phosphatase [Thermoleophilia bacterium]